MAIGSVAMRFFGLGLLLLFVQGRAPLKVAFVGRRTRKIPLSQGFSSCITVHRTVIQFTFFGAPFGMGSFALCGARRLGLLAPLDPLGNGWRVVASRAFYLHAILLFVLGVSAAAFAWFGNAL